MGESNQTAPQLEDFSHRLGELVHNWGFKRIHGKIWSRLFISTRPLDAADLIEQLDISKALVSISLRELLDVRAVVEVGRSARGTNLFRANTDLKAIYTEVLKQRELRMIRETKAALSALVDLGSEFMQSHDISASQIETLDEHLEVALDFIGTEIAQPLVHVGEEQTYTL